MSRKSQAFALQVLASEVAAGTPMSPRLARVVQIVEQDPEVQALVDEEIEDQRAVDRAHREIARYGTMSHAEVMRRLGLRR
jgi:hypothetical protein